VRPLRRLLGRARREHGGFALVELIVAMGLMSVVAIAGYTSVDTFTRATRHAEDRSQGVADARTAIEIILRDLRAANPIDAVTPVSDYDMKVGFSVYCSNVGTDGCGANHLRAVTYRVTANELERIANGTTSTLLGPSGSDSVAPALQRGSIINTVDEPVFTYYDASGTPLLTTGVDAVPATKFRDCARSVRIRLIVVMADGDASSAIELESKVELRNFSEVSQCI
jgi:prepilin-type N-terminal cleavage/methylation domain-containing protein